MKKKRKIRVKKRTYKRRNAKRKKITRGVKRNRRTIRKKTVSKHVSKKIKKRIPKRPKPKKRIVKKRSTLKADPVQLNLKPTKDVELVADGIGSVLHLPTNPAGQKSTLMEVWPTRIIKPEYKAMVNQAINKYKIPNKNYRLHLQNYNITADYFNWGVTKNYSKNSNLIIDSNGVPKVKYGKGFYYNPVTVSQYALHLYGRQLRGENVLDLFLKAVDRLLSMQDSLGAFRYPFEYNYFLKPYKAGWVSGMAQGQALSVLARAYYLTKEEKYLFRGNSALNFLLLPVERGGVMDTMKHLHPSLKNYIIFEEYPVKPASFTLNGFLFTLLGLYDWWKIEPSMNSEFSSISCSNFEKGADTAQRILGYYDIGGYTTYDLSHIVYNRAPFVAGAYHSIHIYLLHALYSITGEYNFHRYEKLWTSYIK